MNPRISVRSLARLAVLGLGVAVAASAFALHPEGDPATGSRKVVIGIVNPGPGVVTLPVRVQVRVFSPKKADGVTPQPIGVGAVTLEYTGTPSGSITLDPSPNYDTTTESGIWEGTLTTNELTAGQSYTLQASGTNGLAADAVWSAPVAITVNAGRGDGNLLVRDNGAQLCSDCHAHQTHSSEATGTKYGSWYAGCRTCHQPHDTTNASLIANQIQPPAVSQALPPANVYFSNRRGYMKAGGVGNKAIASYANGDAVQNGGVASGVCQVCHTQTEYYQRTGKEKDGTISGDLVTGHKPGANCATCHQHKKGFRAECNGCHGAAAGRNPNPAITGTTDGLLAAAPPVTPPDLAPTSFIVAGGGVHQAHVNQARFRKDALVCDDCHLGYGHGDSDVDLGWSTLAKGVGAKAVVPSPAAGATTSGWVADPDCSNYCHGASLADGFPIASTKKIVPSWIAGTMICTSCHGAPPQTASHSDDLTTCGGCHDAAYSPTTVNTTLHMNGTVDASGCTGCHGDDTRTPVLGADANVKMAPPKPYKGSTSDPETVRDVGAHLVHVNKAPALAAASPLACAECHPVPNDHGSVPVSDTSRATMTWGTTATQGGARSQSFIVYDPNVYTCSNTYCHLPTPTAAGTLPAPTWNVPGTLGCGACHGSGSGMATGSHAGHVADASSYKGTTFGCITCHDTADNTSILKKAQHVNTQKEVSASGWSGTACSTNLCHSDGTETPGYVSVTWGNTLNDDCKGCHGAGSTLGEPSYGNVDGNVDTQNSHAKHLKPTDTRAACSACHKDTVGLSGALTASRHLDLDGLADVAGDKIQSYDDANETCSNVSCHYSTSPRWGSTLGCAGCHDSPPPVDTGSNDHPQNGKCDSCHPAGYLTSGLSEQAKLTHVDGTVQKPANGCTACHGTLSGYSGTAVTDNADLNVAPGYVPNASVDTRGNILTSYVGVGAHNAHVTSAIMPSTAKACAVCHGTPPAYPDTAHANGIVARNFGSPATAGGVTVLPTAFDATFEGNPNCTNYCHSTGTPLGGSIGTTQVTWTSQVTVITCASCHKDKATLVTNAHEWHLATGQQYAECQTCHVGTATASTGIVSGGGSHLSGGNNVGFDTVGDARTINAKWTSPNCSSLYCHSNATPLQGALNASKTVAWTATWDRSDTATDNECVQCHAMAADATVSASSTNLSHGHYTHGTTYGYDCAKCHNGIATGKTNYPTTPGVISSTSLHVNKVKNVAFDATNTGAQPYDNATNKCSNTYCHSNGQNPPGSQAANSVTWNATVGCTSCHSAAQAIATGAHQAHVNQATTYGSWFNCQTCHYPTTHDGSTIFAPANHVDATINVDGNPTGSLKYKDAGNTDVNSCTTYCHSSGQGLPGAATPQYYSDMNWKTEALSGCASCHGRYSPGDPLFATTYGAPNYSNTGAGSANANSHRKHVSSAADCYTCHKTTVKDTAGDAIAASAPHLDGNRQVSFYTTDAGTNATYSNDANKRCSSISCHGLTSQPQWGGPSQTCDSCHFGASDAPDYASITNKVASAISSGEWTNFGHGQTIAAFDEFNLASGVTSRCVYCHDDENASANHKQAGNPFRLRGKSTGGVTAAYDTSTLALTNAVCLNCHDIAANSPAGVDPAGSQPPVGPATLRIGAYHAGGKHLGDNGGERCWDCHDPHGDGTNIKMIGTNVLLWGDKDGFVGTRAAASVSFTVRGIGGYTDTVGPPYNGVCQVCHAATDHLGAATSMSYWLSDGTGSHNADQDCIGCHTHNQPPNNAFAGAGACSACHMAVADAGVDSDRDEFPPSTTSTQKSWVDREDWYLTGHGNTTTYSQSGNPGAKFPAPTSTVEPCYYCHAPDTALWASGETSKHTDVGAGNPFRLANTSGGTNKNGVCLVCHAPSSLGFDPDGSAKADYALLNRTTSKAISATHAGVKHGTAADGGTLCWDCHDPHGDYNYAYVASGARGEIAYMVQAKPTKDSADAWGNPSAIAGVVVDFNKATGGSTSALDSYDYVGAGNPAPGVCQVCHSSTTFYRSNGTLTTHENAGQRCAGCHDHQQTPDLAFKQKACNGCHGNRGTARTPAAGADAQLEYAPPTGAAGETATTDRAVGAHVSHVNQTTLRTTALPCSECHPAASHNNTRDMQWGTIATFGSVSPSWDGTGCAATYCHGNFKNGNYQLASLPKPTAAPTGLTFSGVGARTLTLSWSKVANATAYMIERGIGTAPATWVQVARTEGTSFSDGGLANGTDYTYRVSGLNPNGAGPTGAASTKTLTAGPLTTTRYDLYGTGAVNLTTDGSTTIIAQTSYTYSTTTIRTGIAGANVTLSTTLGRVLRSTVTTTNPAANTTFTPVRMYTPTHTATQNPVAANVPLSIDWVNKTVVTNGIGRFEADLVEYKDSTGDVAVRGTWTGTDLSQATTTRTTWNNISATFDNPEFVIGTGNRLKVVIRFVTGATAPGDAALLYGATRATSATAGMSRGYTFIQPTYGVAPDTAPAGAPTGLAVSGFGASSISLTWNTVTNATSYKVERAPESSPGSGVPGTFEQVGQPVANTFTDLALAPSTRYWYQVKASSTASDSAASGSVSQTTGPVNPVWTGTYSGVTPLATTLTCESCHGNPPAGTHPAANNCSLCHTGYDDKGTVPQKVATGHINTVVEKATDCTVCHAVQLGARRPIVGEFSMTWSHKRSAGGVVNKWDCIVCHMEGDPTSGLPRDGVAGGHMDGNINLRDPDTGAEILNVTFSNSPGATAVGSYGAGSGNPTIPSFSRDLAVALDNDPAKAQLQAIQQNLCMKCHDGDGATAFLASNPNAGNAQGALYVMRAQGGTRTAPIPFGTAISYAAVPVTEGGTATAPSGVQTAGGVAGGVIRIDTAFATSNSSYHPVAGRNNNSYAYGSRMMVPYDTGVTGRVAGNITNYGYLLSCWDCHAPKGSTVLTKTVTAHGGSETVRGRAFFTWTTQPTNGAETDLPTATTGVDFCNACHKGYNTSNTTNHGSGSAFSLDGSGQMQNFANFGCNRCHGSNYTERVVRPIRAEDVHGFNTLPTTGTGTKTGRWAGTGVQAAPYAFIRNTKTLANHQPRQIGTTTYTMSCWHGSADVTYGDGFCDNRGDEPITSIGGVF